MAYGAWEQSIKEFTKSAEDDADHAMRAISMDAANELIVNSAVDTGRFRKNWSAKLNSPSTRAVTWAGQRGNLYDKWRWAIKFRHPMTNTEQRNLDPIYRAKLKDTVFITNNIWYAKLLESGNWSDMMPYGVLFITARRIAAKWRAKKFNISTD